MDAEPGEPGGPGEVAGGGAEAGPGAEGGPVEGEDATPPRAGGGAEEEGLPGEGEGPAKRGSLFGGGWLGEFGGGVARAVGAGAAKARSASWSVGVVAKGVYRKADAAVRDMLTTKQYKDYVAASAKLEVMAEALEPEQRRAALEVMLAPLWSLHPEGGEAAAVTAASVAEPSPGLPVSPDCEPKSPGRADVGAEPEGDEGQNSEGEGDEAGSGPPSPKKGGLDTEMEQAFRSAGDTLYFDASVSAEPMNILEVFLRSRALEAVIAGAIRDPPPHRGGGRTGARPCAVLHAVRRGGGGHPDGRGLLRC